MAQMNDSATQAKQHSAIVTAVNIVEDTSRTIGDREKVMKELWESKQKVQDLQSKISEVQNETEAQNETEREHNRTESALNVATMRTVAVHTNVETQNGNRHTRADPTHNSQCPAGGAGVLPSMDLISTSVVASAVADRAASGVQCLDDYNSDSKQASQRSNKNTTGYHGVVLVSAGHFRAECNLGKQLGQCNLGTYSNAEVASIVRESFVSCYNYCAACPGGDATYAGGDAFKSKMTDLMAANRKMEKAKRVGPMIDHMKMVAEHMKSRSPGENIMVGIGTTIYTEHFVHQMTYRSRAGFT